MLLSKNKRKEKNNLEFKFEKFKLAGRLALLRNTIKILTLFLFLITTFSVSNAAQIDMGNGYKIQLPNGYEKDKALSYEGTDVFSNKECNITFNSRRMGKYDSRDIKVQASNVERQLKTSTFKILKNTIGEIKNNPMFCIKYSMPYSKAIWYQYGIISDDVMFIVTCTTTSEKDKKYEQEFNKIVNTLSK